MRKRRLTGEQMVAALRDADKTSEAARAKKQKVIEPTIYSWRYYQAGRRVLAERAAAYEVLADLLQFDTRGLPCTPPAV